MTAYEDTCHGCGSHVRDCWCVEDVCDHCGTTDIWCEADDERQEGTA